MIQNPNYQALILITEDEHGSPKTLKQFRISPEELSQLRSNLDSNPLLLKAYQARQEAYSFDQDFAQRRLIQLAFDKMIECLEELDTGIPQAAKEIREIAEQANRFQTLKQELEREQAPKETPKVSPSVKPFVQLVKAQ